ncbi:hypothetical protein OAS39_13050 [Pirellulales bacterium]|nr:hypothetical protein [Pirellulales bacterium]
MSNDEFADEMNLGDVYFKTFVAITAIAFVAGFACAFSLRLIRRIHAGWLVALGLLLTVVLTVVGNGIFHHTLFTTWHRSQNTFVPQTGCLTYDPSFGHLYATYSMDASSFKQFIASHPWELRPHDSSLESIDARRLGFDAPQAAYATEMAPNGKQLRIYFENGKMFLSYNVM